ncbi:MAG: deacetylase [Candidatus Binatia bacterium]|nr:MAG: deacetylase [Candidatus Binatia bacterium]
MEHRVLDDRARERLRYVRVRQGPVDLSRFPDFLVVGPQRTGTTWLHAHLRFHPDVFLAEPKELFFFNRLKDPSHPRFRSNELEWYLSFFSDPWWRWLGKNLLTLARYGEFYRPRVRGEATASYAAMERDLIEEIHALNPRLKVVLTIRHPVDRAWSHAKKDLARNRGRRLEDVPPEEWKAFFLDPYQLRCGRYAELYETWAGVFGPENVFVGRFEDIATRPEGLLLDVLRFLGARAEPRFVPRSVRRVVNPTHRSEVPAEHRAFLSELFRDEIQRARERFGVDWALS